MLIQKTPIERIIDSLNLDDVRILLSYRLPLIYKNYLEFGNIPSFLQYEANVTVSLMFQKFDYFTPFQFEIRIHNKDGKTSTKKTILVILCNEYSEEENRNIENAYDPNRYKWLRFIDTSEIEYLTHIKL